MRIVLTRRPAQAGDLEAEVRRAGFALGFLPLTRQLLPEDTTALNAAVAELERGAFDWLLVTSANTVRALKSCGWAGELPGRTQAAAVGPGTARVLQMLTGDADIWTPRDHSAAGILAELPAPSPGQRILLPQSAQARPELADGLCARGWDLTHVQAYRTVPAAALSGPLASLDAEVSDPHPQRPSEEVLEPTGLRADDVVLLTSSTAAEAYADLTVRPPARLMAIGGPTAQTMSRRGLSPAAVLAEPTPDGLLEALKDLGLDAEAESLDWGPHTGTEHAQTTPGGD